MKLAVIYDSKTNNTAAVAGYMAEAMNSLEGVEAKTFLYSEVDTEFVKECKGVVFGCPTYAAGPTSDFYTWMEKNAGGLNLAGKYGGSYCRLLHLDGKICKNLKSGWKAGWCLCNRAVYPWRC